MANFITFITLFAPYAILGFLGVMLLCLALFGVLTLIERRMCQ